MCFGTTSPLPDVIGSPGMLFQSDHLISDGAFQPRYLSSNQTFRSEYLTSNRTFLLKSLPSDQMIYLPSFLPFTTLSVNNVLLDALRFPVLPDGF